MRKYTHVCCLQMYTVSQKTGPYFIWA